MPIMPAMRRIIVLPVHMMKFMNPTRALDAIVLEKNLNGWLRIPAAISIWFTGPWSENNVKNNMENADAMMRFGRYMTVLKKRCPFRRRDGSVNQYAMRSERTICGMKPMTHMMRVFDTYFHRSGFSRMET